MTTHSIIKNALGQVVDIGTLIVYPKVVGTMKVKMTPGAVTDIDDSKNGPKLQVTTAQSQRPVVLSNLSKVIVVDINSLDLPVDEMRLLKEVIANAKR